MKIKQIIKLIEGEVVCCEQKIENEVVKAFASDLMSDVLRVDINNILLITGLANLQTIRTAEMADISYILLVRGKKATPEMIEISKENGILLIETKYSMYRCCGLLYQEGLKPVY